MILRVINVLSFMKPPCFLLKPYLSIYLLHVWEQRWICVHTMACMQMSEDNFQESVHFAFEARSLVCLKSCWVVLLYLPPILLQKFWEHLMCTPPSSYSDCTQILLPTEPSSRPLPYSSQICTLVCISMCRPCLFFWYMNNSRELQSLTYWVLYSFEYVTKCLLFQILSISKFSGLILELQKLLTEVQPVTNALKETKQKECGSRII